MKERFKKACKITATIMSTVLKWVWFTFKLGLFTHGVFLAHEELEKFFDEI